MNTTKFAALIAILSCACSSPASSVGQDPQPTQDGQQQPPSENNPATPSTAPTQSIVGTWFYASPNGTDGFGYSFRADGTYVGMILRLTSSTSADAFEEQGTYTSSAGQISFSPTSSTCPSTEPPYTDSYRFSGSSLVLTSSSEVQVLQPDASMASSVVIVLGCFATDGTFTTR